MAYCDAERVAGYVGNLLGEERQFSADSDPTLDTVNMWLSSGCAFIEATLSSWKYSVPPAADSAVYGMCAELNALYAAAYAEMSRTNVLLEIGQRTRGQVFEKMFWDYLERMQRMDLTLAGATRSGVGGKLFAGGLTQASKDEMTKDIVGRFRRGMFRFPGTQNPGTVTGSNFGGIINTY